MNKSKLNNILFILLVIVLIITVNNISISKNDDTELYSDFNSNNEEKTDKTIKNSSIEDKTQDIIHKEIPQKRKKEKKITNKEKIISNEIITSSNVYERESYDLIIEEKNTILSLAKDRQKRYNILLRTSKSITSILPPSNNISLKIKLSDNGEDIKDDFILMINSNYKELTEYFLFEIENVKTNGISICDGMFLNGITSEKIYTLQMDISGNLLSCYIIKEEINKSYVNKEDNVYKSIDDEIQELIVNRKTRLIHDNQKIKPEDLKKLKEKFN